MKPKVMAISDNSIMIEYPAEISEEINRCIRSVTREIGDRISDLIVDIIPAYHTITVNYDCLDVDYNSLLEKIEEIVSMSMDDGDEEREIVEIPVCYEEPYGLDIDEVCSIHNMTREELVKRHTAPEYLVYMVGFTPGFPYLGGMDESIATPRKKEPRSRIPAGSVGIAGSQTGVYPIESPGGWQIIGRTPLKLFDPYRENPVLIEAGQYIKYRSISSKEYEEMERNPEVDHG
ncbi:sensor histidine kinase inhibitor, KipI family [Dethiosulfatibacter aminovorans DSM 17477]|uniref:Sensor histidine kinase inhibitor, KipI family n=1 Tax=Dethiosulfatibacter aminovorans DSM 17477 TaxID=1121476 RepID=A0A1M6HE38_9FIRM|nr:5-oxoprolinase subunit PxpB [Dethiosulfatibacter aminovorans]SHJ20455.1 sensor histidine kinase inhibitor, KipI family [Dethiosulfatibacter aminovorans DSM 17477]